MKRESGFYWVRDRRYGWTIARWDAVQNWWIMGWLSMDDPAFPNGNGCPGDSRFEEISERRLLSPEERGLMDDGRKPTGIPELRKSSGGANG